MEPTWIILNFLVLFGGFSVCLAFTVLLPGVGQLVASMWSTVMLEQVISRAKGRPSGTDMEGFNG